MNTASFISLCILVGASAGLIAHRYFLDDGPREIRAMLAPGVLDARESRALSAPDSAGPVDTTNRDPIDQTRSQASNASQADGAGTPPTAVELDAVSLASGQVWSYNAGIMRVAPSVVSLYASVQSDETHQIASQGSGVIIDPDGIVLTNLHLLEGTDAINVVLSDGTLHTGTLMGSDRETDLAVIAIDATELPAISLDEAAPLRVGDVVLAIGNPFGVGQTVTQGIVSATRRRIAGGSAWQDFVQIDAAINPGSSGGALINPAGELVGVTTAVFRGNKAGATASNEDLAVGIGFAIPADLLVRVVPEIITDGRVLRGWLGIEADDLPMFPALHRISEHGAVITAVTDDSPAATAGLRPGDVVTELDGQRIDDATQLLLLVSSLGPGTLIDLTVRRDTSSVSVPVSLGERPPPGNDLPRRARPATPRG